VTVRPAITETDWQRQVVELARITGWRTMHVRRSRGKGRQWQTTTSCAGWPDLILWRDRVIAAELKSERGHVTLEQANVLASLEHAGIEVHVWRPADLDTIVAILNRR
jgi:hypothetical protein